MVGGGNLYYLNKRYSKLKFGGWNWSKISQGLINLLWPYYSRKSYIAQRFTKESAKERSNGHGRIILGYSLVSKDSPKKFLGLYLIHKRHNKKMKAIFRIILIFVPPSQLWLDTTEAYIHKRSTPDGQQLPNLKSQKVTALYLAYKNKL